MEKGEGDVMLIYEIFYEVFNAVWMVLCGLSLRTSIYPVAKLKSTISLSISSKNIDRLWTTNLHNLLARICAKLFPKPRLHNENEMSSTNPKRKL